MNHENWTIHRGYERWRQTTPPNQQSERNAWVAGYRAALDAEAPGDVRAAAERLLRETSLREDDRTEYIWDLNGSLPRLEDDIELVARYARAEARGEALEAATACADLLVRLVRPMHAGPTGDQGINDPLYGECLRAINRYRRSRTALAMTAEARGDGLRAALIACQGIIHEGLHGGRATDPEHQAACEMPACRRIRAALAGTDAAPVVGDE